MNWKNKLILGIIFLSACDSIESKSEDTGERCITEDNHWGELERVCVWSEDQEKVVCSNSCRELTSWPYPCSSYCPENKEETTENNL